MEYVYYLEKGVLTKLSSTATTMTKTYVKPGTLYWNTAWENNILYNCALKSMSHGEVRHAAVIWEDATLEETQMI